SLKLASAVILMSQLLIATPFHVLASENSTYKIAKERTETTEMSNSDVTAESSELLTTSSSESSTTSNAESSTTSSSESSTTSNAESSTTSSSESSTTSNAESSTTSSSESSTISSTESSTTSSSTSEITSSKVTKPNHIESSKKEAPKTEGQTKTFSTPQQIESTESFQSQPILSGNEEIHFDKNESVENFIMKIGESARKIGQKYDLYASVMIAQAILESASGQSQLAQAPNYNLFGIKGTYNGNFVIMVTNEDLGNGTLYTTQSKFRVYENYEESFEDYAKLLTKGISGNKDFYAGALKANSKTYREATKFLTGRYATDTQYYLKLNELIKTYDLTNYDKEVKGPQMSKTGYQVPIHNYSITSLFGNRGNEFHRGLDMAATQGEPIHAVKAGKVVKAEFHYSWGNYVVIQHEDGSTALYAHQQQYLVKTGDNVLQGQIIGYVGSTGNSTGPHLHLEICKDSSLSQSMLVDPKTLLFGD
ncbi:TPA: glucosaminidase domain-containing protein, partial [Enterococcus faecium]